MTDNTEQTPEPLSPERIARRNELVERTQAADEIYTRLQNNAKRRDKLLAAELEAGATVKDLAALLGVSIGRIYKLKSTALARATEQ